LDFRFRVSFLEFRVSPQGFGFFPLFGGLPTLFAVSVSMDLKQKAGMNQEKARTRLARYLQCSREHEDVVIDSVFGDHMVHSKVL
jgi:hypothetical protein